MIILNYEGVPTERIEDHHPRLVHVDAANRMVELASGEAAVGQFAQRYGQACESLESPESYDNIVSVGNAG